MEVAIKQNKLILYIALAVVVIHGIIVLFSLIPDIRGRSLNDSLRASDQSTYINNARAMIMDGAFTRENNAPFLWEPYRTPGLPLLIYLSLVLFNSLLPVLAMNVLLSGVAAYAGCKLLLLFDANKKILICFGALIAFLPNVLGTDCYVLTDSIFAYLNLIWMYFFIRTIRFQKMQDVLAGSVCLAYAQLTKPTLSVAFVLILIMVIALYWRKWSEINYKQVVLLLLLSLAAPFYLSYRMYMSHGIFTPTLLGEETKREYLTANYFADKTGKDYYTIQQEIRTADKKAVEQIHDDTKSYYGNLYSYKKMQNDSLTATDPIGFGKVFLIESIKQLIAPQESIFGVFYPVIPKIVRIIGSILNLAFLVLVGIGCYVFFLKKKYAYIIIVCMFYGFYISAGSMSSRQGGRFRLPADVIALPIAAIGLSFLLNKNNRTQGIK